MTVNLGGNDVVVEAETYIGLTISGEEGTVNEIARRVRTMLVRG